VWWFGHGVVVQIVTKGEGEWAIVQGLLNPCVGAPPTQLATSPIPESTGSLPSVTKSKGRRLDERVIRPRCPSDLGGEIQNEQATM
jgi:hypothetical protein